MGLAAFFIYYFLFKFLIEKFNLKTPGREDEPNEKEGKTFDEHTDFTQMAKTILAGIGGKENIDTLHYCITRLRFEVKDETKVNEKQITSSGISGIIRPSQKSVQVVVGPQVQFVYDEIMKIVGEI